MADRIRLPEEPPSVDISKWLGPDLWMAFVEPRSLRSLPARPVTWARPRPRRLGREEKAMLQTWDRTGRLLLAGAALDPLHRFSTLRLFAGTRILTGRSTTVEVPTGKTTGALDHRVQSPRPRTSSALTAA